MFKSAATKIAHNTTIPALAGNSDLRPLQDLITAEKTVLMSLQKLRIDLAKAGDALRIWGQGEGDDLGDILTASSTVLAHFASALTTYSSLHHTVRDSMKSVRTREEALDELRRRRRRVGATAEAAEKKLNKMSPEHKNLSIQTDTLNKLRDEMRALDGEILREETELGDYKRKCTRDWMSFKFGGLVECCEKGVIVGDIGRQIIQSIPEDVTQPGLPRAHYDAHGRVGNLVMEAERAVSQVTFSSHPTGHIAAPTSQPPPFTSQDPAVQSPFLPTPSLGSDLTLGVPTYNPPPGPPPGHTFANRRASVDELGVHAPTHPPPQFSSLPVSRERNPPASSSVVPTQPLSSPVPYDGGVPATEENQSLMASIADALSQSHRGFSLEDATSLGHPAPDEPAPKYESISADLARSAQSDPHGPATNGHVGPHPLAQQGEGQRRTMRRSTSPPSLPPGAAPAAIRAWDDRMGQGEDGAHSDRPGSSSARVPSQRLISSSERDGEEEEGLAYDRRSPFFEEDAGHVGDGKHHEEDALFSEGAGEANADATQENSDDQGTIPIQGSLTSATSDGGDTTLLSRAESQWRIPRVPPPSMEQGKIDIHQPAARRRHSVYSTGTGAREEEDARTDESADQRVRNAAAAREVSREMDALAFSAATLSPSGHATPRGRGMSLSTQSQTLAPYPHTSPPLPPSPSGRTPSSAPPSPIVPPNPPFANRGRISPMMEVRYARGHHPAFSDGGPPRLPTPTPGFVPPSVGGAPTIPGSSPPLHRSPLEYPRPTPPFSSPLMASSSSSLNSGGEGTSPGGAPRTISAAAFRRQQVRSPSGTDVGPADTSPLALRKPSGSPLPGSRQPQVGSGLDSTPPAPTAAKARLSVVNPDPRMSDEEEAEGHEFDYIVAYEKAGYGAGRYVSDLEREQ